MSDFRLAIGGRKDRDDRSSHRAKPIVAVCPAGSELVKVDPRVGGRGSRGTLTVHATAGRDTERGRKGFKVIQGNSRFVFIQLRIAEGFPKPDADGLAPSLPFSRPCGLRYSQILFATSQVAQIPLWRDALSRKACGLGATVGWSRVGKKGAAWL